MAFYNPVQQAADAAQAQASYLGVNHVQGHNVSSGIPHLGCLSALGPRTGGGGHAIMTTGISTNCTISNNIITNTAASTYPVGGQMMNTGTSVSGPHWISVPSPIHAGMYTNTLANQAQPLRYPDPPKAQFFNFLVQIEDDEWRFEPSAMVDPRPPNRGVRRLKSPYDDAIHKMLDRRSFNYEKVSLSAFIGFLLCNGFYRSEISERVERVRLMGIELV